MGIKAKIQRDEDVDKYKARFVAWGFTQKKGFDYNKTYSSTTKFTIRVLMAIAIYFDYHIHQMDVKYS